MIIPKEENVFWSNLQFLIEIWENRHERIKPADHAGIWRKLEKLISIMLLSTVL